MNLTNIRYLSLGANVFNMRLPEHIWGNITGLLYLDVGNNHLTGSLPSALGLLHQLQASQPCAPHAHNEAGWSMLVGTATHSTSTIAWGMGTK